MLTQQQQKAIEDFLYFLIDPTPGEMLLLGHSGTGKTYVTGEMIKSAQAQSNLLSLILSGSDDLRIECTATTNKAAAVLSGAVSYDTSTIHQLLGLKVHNNLRNGTTFLKKTANYQIMHNSLIIIDEASMIDDLLLKHIREATVNCKVLYVLDPYQLTAMFCPTCPVYDSVPKRTQLTDIVRQRLPDGSMHPIAVVGQQFKDMVITGITPEIVFDGKYVIHADGDEFRDRINAEFSGQNLLDPNHAKIMAWTNNKVQAYNTYVRGLYTNTPTYMVGEQLVTNKPIAPNIKKNRIKGYSTDSIVTVVSVSAPCEYKGVEGYYIDLGNTTRVFQPYSLKAANTLINKLRKNKEYPEMFEAMENMADLRPIHSSTIHKGQGSTFGKAFIDLDDIGKCHDLNQVARMLYVASTRPKEQLIMYGHLPNKFKPGWSL